MGDWLTGIVMVPSVINEWSLTVGTWPWINLGYGTYEFGVWVR